MVLTSPAPDGTVSRVLTDSWRYTKFGSYRNQGRTCFSFRNDYKLGLLEPSLDPTGNGSCS